jgi:beta-galactosidase
MPSDLSDFTLYGGLYRNVHLVYLPAVSLEMVHLRVNLEADRSAHITVEGRLYNPGHLTGPAQVAISILDPAGVEIYRIDRQMILWDGELPLADCTIANPALWSPNAPLLYTCRVKINSRSGESLQSERFGIRSFEFQEHGPFLLNGERLLLQGTHRHEDHAGYAAAMPADLIRQEMKLIKEMGANFIRLAHYQQQRLVLELCDELGILVWEELPWCRAGVGGEAFQKHGREKLSAMIDQHRNHPSIILWGLGNEDDWVGEYPSVDKNAIRSYMRELHLLAHKLDPSRLTSLRRCDFARDIPDVYSPSIWAGWYGGQYTDYEAALKEQIAKSPRLLHVEWGADSHARRHAEDPYQLIKAVKNGDTEEKGLDYLLEGGSARVSRDGDWSETYACDLFDWHLKTQQSLPLLTGAVQWAFKDFTTPLRADNPVPRINQKGVIERDMTLKEGYFVFQSYWTDKPMVHIYGHSWPVRWGAINEPRMVRVYSNCASVELFVNGVSAGIRKRDAQDFPAAGLRWQLPFQAGQNTLRAVATATDGSVLSDEISFMYQTEKWGAPQKLDLRMIDRDAGMVTVEATLHDMNGVLCLDARNVVRFKIAGSSTLLDNQGTSTGSRLIELYNGRACIKIFKSKGIDIVTVSSEAIAPAFCTV